MLPNVLFAFPVIRSMGEFQDRLLEMSTPKYLELVTTSSRIWPCKIYCVDCFPGCCHPRGGGGGGGGGTLIFSYT